MDKDITQRLVVVGGGAGGLELTVRLARKYRKNPAVTVTLVDRNPTHIWKPLLHEIATGSLNGNHDETSYLMLAKKFKFSFVMGSVEHIDTDAKQLRLAAVTEANGDSLVNERQLGYDKLVLSVGSICNDFGTPGVMEHSLLLDTRVQAERFHTQFVSQLHRINAQSGDADTQDNHDASLSLIIVGAGATGVELAADLHSVAEQLPSYGFNTFSRDKLRVQLIEAGPRILPALPERVSASVHTELTELGVEVLTDTRVSAIEAQAINTADGRVLDANLVVWAAGVQAPAFLGDSGLPVDRIGRVHVTDQLLVQGHNDIFSIGDCCACEMPDGGYVPPRAQSAHQMASVAYKNLVRQLDGKPLKTFLYKDLGSLISLSKFSTVGNLMGNLMRGTVFVEGWLARLFYLSLYRMHQLAIHGWWATSLIMLNDRLYKATRADIKLH